jgi:hypothetical protein
MSKHVEKLKFLLDRSNSVYKQYLGNKIYGNAFHIKLNNKKIIDYLLEDGYLFKDHDAVFIVLDHFESRYIQFIEHEKNVISNEDEFIFERASWATQYPTLEIKKLITE